MSEQHDQPDETPQESPPGRARGAGAPDLPGAPATAAETDPRFPSGPWKGFWLQQGYAGRQWMELNLTFVGGKLAGEGRDRVGAFTLAGTYDLKTGRCDFLKRYVRQHAVAYHGYNEPALWLWGTWRLPFDHGGFHVWPAQEKDPTAPHLAAEETMPVPQLMPV